MEDFEAPENGEEFVPRDFVFRARQDFEKKSAEFQLEIAKTSSLIHPDKTESKPTGVAWLLFRARKMYPGRYVSFSSLGLVFGVEIKATKEAAMLRARIQKARVLLEDVGWVVSNLPDKGYRLTKETAYAEKELFKTLSRAKAFNARFLRQYETNLRHSREMSSDAHIARKVALRFETQATAVIESFCSATGLSEPQARIEHELQVKPTMPRPDPENSETKMLEGEDYRM